jgi:poly(A) polymerase
MSKQLRHTAMPKKFSGAIKEIWTLQRPLEHRKPKQIEKLLHHPRFRAAYDFLLLRSNIGEVDPAIVQWWTEIQLLPPEQHHTMVKALKKK